MYAPASHKSTQLFSGNSLTTWAAWAVLAIVVLSMIATGYAAPNADELKPLADKAIGWTTNIAIVGLFLGLAWGVSKAAMTNRMEPAFFPVGLGVAWGVLFGIISVALGAPILL
jgi:hypothetical protein